MREEVIMIYNKINYFIFTLSLVMSAQAMDPPEPLYSGTLLERIPNDLMKIIDTYSQAIKVKEEVLKKEYSNEDIEDLRTTKGLWSKIEKGRLATVRNDTLGSYASMWLYKEFCITHMLSIINRFNKGLKKEGMAISRLICPITTDNFKPLYFMLTKLDQDNSKITKWLKETERERTKVNNWVSPIFGSARSLMLEDDNGNKEKWYIAKYEYRADTYSKPLTFFIGIGL